MLRSIVRCVLALPLLGLVLSAQDGPLRASQIMKMSVMNAAHDVVGEVRDVVVDPQIGGFSYAIVSFNRLPAKAGKLYAVPWAALNQTGDRKALVLSVL